MNINLIYRNNSFNFDLRSDISISYLEDLASKLINKEKSSFELLYKEEILSENKKLLLKDVIKPKVNEPINIYINTFEKQVKQKQIFPKIKLFNNVITKPDNYESKNNNIFLNETEISQSLSENSLKLFHNFSRNNFKKKKKVEFTIQNKVFEETYNSKDNELFSLLKTLSQKIKEYDDILYKKNKNNISKNNIELITYENNIIAFKDKQIKFIKKLLNFFDNKDISILSEKNNDLDEFYSELKQYDNKNYFERIQKKKNIDIIKKQLLSPINLNNDKSCSFSNKELPLLMNNNKNSSKFLFNSSIKKNNNSEKVFKNEEEKKDKIFLNSEKNKNKKKPIFDKNTNDKLHFKINYQEEKNYKTIDDNKNKNNKTLLKKNSIGNTTKSNTNPSEISNSNSAKPQDKTKKINIILPKTLNNNNNEEKQKNKNNNIKNNPTRNKKPYDLFKRVNTIQNINYNKSKVSQLFEISESYIRENKESESERYKNDSIESKSSENKECNSSGHIKKYNSFNENDNENENENEDIKKLKTIKKKKTFNYSLIKNAKIGYLIKAKYRKVNQRIKKLGTHESDFLI